MAKKAARKAAVKAAKTKKAAPRRAAKPARRPGGTGQYVYLFGRKTDGNGGMKPLLGG